MYPKIRDTLIKYLLLLTGLLQIALVQKVCAIVSHI